ncbi:MAG TPA: phosphate ABC transporter permease subunit PstC [Steroidobacteraceae bacterium]|nr:phosphate ABC transporter permease subunit PstC [Steroidobacteraceae bacterium]
MATTPAYLVQLRRDAHVEGLFKRITSLSAWMVLLLLAGVIVTLVYGSMPALKAFKWDFLTSTKWNPVENQFGALAPLYGTVVTSIIAMIIAVPLSFGIAVFLTETCPRWLRGPISTAIELLASIPSIVFGIWGLFVLAPVLQETLQPWLIDHLGKLPFIGFLFQGAPYGIGILTASMVLAIMVLPFITAVMREVFSMAPRSLKEAAYGMGATQWNVVWDVVVPWSRAGMIGGIMLGLGRALGETMAVTFVIGNANRISTSILAPGTTISASIANEFTEATTPLYTSSLIALGLLLFVITFVVIAGARLMLRRLERGSVKRA